MRTEMSETLATVNEFEKIEQVLVTGDLASLKPAERVLYYKSLCQSMGLNPLAKPFEFLLLKKPGEETPTLTLYATASLADQLRARHGVSVRVVSKHTEDGVYYTEVEGSLPNGRTEIEIAGVPVVREDGEWKTTQNGKRYWAGNGVWKPLSPLDTANARMKCFTKAKRRVTLRLISMGFDLFDGDALPQGGYEEVSVADGYTEHERPRPAVDPTVNPFAVTDAEKIQDWMERRRLTRSGEVYDLVAAADGSEKLIVAAILRGAQDWADVLAFMGDGE